MFNFDSFILAEEKTDLEGIQRDTEQELKIDDISIPDNYEELLEQYKETVKLALEFKNLDYEERKDKLEAIKLAEKLTHKYEAERTAHKKAEDLFRELDKRVDRLLKIIEVQEELLNELINILDSQSGGLGFYGGIGYKPAYPLESSLEAGITVDF